MPTESTFTIPGIPPRVTDAIAAAGYTLDRLRAEGKEEELAVIPGVGPIWGAKVVRAFREQASLPSSPPPPAP